MKSMDLLLCLFVFIISCPVFCGNLNVAVNELKAEGIKKSAANIITDRIRSEMINTGVFRVMERSEMKSVLKEQGFQQSGACENASCLVEVGQLLGVDRMVAGSVGKLDSFYTISLRMINVATGEILYTVSVDLKGGIEDVISKATSDAALKLARSAGPDVARALISGKKGDLYITSDMTGSSIEIDGKKIHGKTPLTLQGFPAGEHRIVARMRNHFGSKTVTLAPDDLLKVHIPMSEGRGALKIFTRPPGATVYLDGVSRGKSPLKLSNVPAGEHVVRVQNRGYLAKETAVMINLDETANFSADLEPAAYITVRSTPSTAVIMVNGRNAGDSAIESYEVPAGETTVQVEAPGYDPYVTTRNISKGKTMTLDVNLVSSFGALNALSDPPGARVWLNGKEAGETPYTNSRLVPGSYSVKIELSAHDPYETTIAVVKAQTRKISAQLVSKFGKLAITSVPHGAHVFLNGHHAGQTPYSNYELDPGIYGIQLKLDNYSDIVETLQLSKGHSLNKHFVLEHTKDYLDSISAVKKARYRRFRWKRRIFFGALAAGFSGAGVYFNGRSSEYYDAYMANSGYDVEAHGAAWKKVEDAYKQRNTMYIISGVFCIGLAVSIPF
jgi:hypothetical protein